MTNVVPPTDENAPPAANLGSAIEQGSEAIGRSTSDRPASRGPHDKMRKRSIFVVLLAQFTIYLAFVAPSAFSLAIRVQTLDPANKNTVLALAIGIPGVIALFTNPLVGVLSDRTRSRFGRRRPWLVVGLVFGLVGSIVIGFVPSSVVLIIGWTIAFIGYSISTLIVITYFGDHLPEAQRGRVMGINGAITQIGPIIGIVLAGALSGMPALMFLIPGAVAFAGGVLFAILMKDGLIDSEPAPIRFATLLQGYWFNPRRFPNLGWVWLSKALVFLAIAFMSIYSVYLLSSRLGIKPTEIAGVVSITGILGVGTAIVGALFCGWLSDKVGSRKPFLVGGSLLLAAAMITVATTSSLPQYIVGTTVAAFAIGVYGAVDQAVQLDVLPQEEDQNGRFLGVLGLANQAPQAVGPFLAAAVLGLAAGNYAWVYIASAIAAVLGALAILPISVGRRATTSTTSLTVPSK